MKRDLDKAFHSLSLEDEAKKVEKIKLESPASQWISVYTSRPLIKQRYHYNISDTRVYIHIEKGSKDGLFVSCVASSSSLWAFIMDSGTGYTSQVYDLSSDFLRKDWIMEQWEKNYHITSLAGAINGKSLVIISQATNYTHQSYKVTRTFPITWINQKWRDGFHVTSMATTRSRWCVVMSANSCYSDQVVELDSLHLSERIQQKSESGYRITSMAATIDETAFILSIPKQKVTDDTQETLRTSSFPRTNIREQWAKNMFVTSICYGRTVSSKNALTCDDIPVSLAALNISDNHHKSGNEESLPVTTSPRKRECFSLSQGKERVLVANNEVESCSLTKEKEKVLVGDNNVECFDEIPNALAALHISDNHQKSLNDSPQKLDSFLPCQGKDKVIVCDRNVLPITHSDSVALPSTSGTCEGQEEDKTTCKIEKST